MTHLTGKRVAVVATNGYEDSELTEPIAALREHGAVVDIIAPEGGTIKGKHGHEAAVDLRTRDARCEDYDALLLPGGTINGDHIRVDKPAIEFTREFFTQHKPVGAICHGGWILAEADVLRGRTVTSVANISTDLKNAGANWVDEEVVVDHGLVTSRTPDDLPAFSAKLVEEVAEGKHSGQTS